VKHAAAVVLVLLACSGEGFAWARSQSQETRLAQAERAYRTGQYDEAINIQRQLTASDTSPVAARRGLIRSLAAVGRYDEAEAAGRRFLGLADGAQVANVLGEVLAARGRDAAAESLYTRAVSGRAADSLTAKLNLAVLHFERGDRTRAMQEFDAFIDIYNRGARRLTAAELMAVGTACKYLGRDDPQLFKDALTAYDRAIAADSTDPEPRIRLGELFTEKYSGSDAQQTLDAALAHNPKHPRALVASARRRYQDGEPGATELLRQSIAVNPGYADAHVFLAQLAIDAEDYATALDEANKALATDPTSAPALAMLGATRYLQGDAAGFDDVSRRAAAANPSDATFYIVLAQASARNRLYKEAAAFARKGTELDAKAWPAWGLLGMNELRTGLMREGRGHLDQAFKGDPYDVWIKNTLDLLDATATYPETSSPRFRFVVDSAESGLFTLYAASLAEEAYDSLAARYGYRPPTPIRLEVYANHADFSVRTVGLAGLGALGVSFGNVMAMDSPSARPVGEFNWGSTLWHELAHVFTLGMTDHRVPRWLSEGLSVYEERRARHGWGADVTPDFLLAFKAGRLAPPSRMNDGFIRPQYPQQVIHSYYEASLLCEMIEKEFGPRAIVDMLNGYKSGFSSACSGRIPRRSTRSSTPT
jgi:tetratricopeptide (TPR) repeat protein